MFQEYALKGIFKKERKKKTKDFVVEPTLISSKSDKSGLWLHNNPFQRRMEHMKGR